MSPPQTDMRLLPWEQHGPLRVSANGHYVEHADGKGFFWLADTAWHLVSLGPDDVDRYLADRAARGFDVVLFIATNNARPNYAGALPIVGEGPPWQTAALDGDYWRHVDYVIARAAGLGLYVGFLVWWGYNADGPVDEPEPPRRQFFADPDRENHHLGRLLGERYGGFPNVIWIVSGEYQTPYRVSPVTPEAHLARHVELARGIREGDRGRHLMTIHPFSFLSSSEEFHDADWLDLNLIQTHVYPDYIDHLVLGDWRRVPPKPTLNVEGLYEREETLWERRSGLHLDSPLDADWVQRYQAYWSVFHGGIGYGYGHCDLWRMEDEAGRRGVLLDSALAAPGARSLRHLRALMESLPIQTRVPDADLVTPNTRGSDALLRPNLKCATRDAEGRWALVYSTRGEFFRVDVARLASGRASAHWYDPRTGRWWAEVGESEERVAHERGIPVGPGVPPRTFVPPGEPVDGNDWVLLLELEGPR